MPLNDMQIRRAKPEAKAYTLGDGQGLSLLIEPNGSKSWRFRYRYAGKPKMISLGVYPTITLADARSRRDDARKLVAEGKNPSEVRKEQKIFANGIRKCVRKDSYRVASDEVRQMVGRICVRHHGSVSERHFPVCRDKTHGEIKPLELLNVLRKIEKRGALENAQSATALFRSVSLCHSYWES
jgi:hypothetical protein